MQVENTCVSSAQIKRGCDVVRSKRPYLRVPVKMGETAKKRLRASGLLDLGYRIESRDGSLYMPLKTQVPAEVLRDVLGMKKVETGELDFEPFRPIREKLSDVLTGDMSSDEVRLLPRSYDLIGDIAVLEIPSELAQHEQEIGAAFLKIHHNFSTVLVKRGAISGVIRTREYDLIAGVDKTDTVHVEYGCRIAVDLAKAYFSPRLLEEHHRVAGQVQDGETVIDMFTGVGPFALHIATTKRADVYAIDINPDAIALLERSMEMNRLVGTIHPVVADAGIYVRANFQKRADRVIMNHPKGASEFIALACMGVTSGGVVHYYDFAGGTDPEEQFTQKVKSLVAKSGRSLRSIGAVRRVRDSAPYEYQMVADLIID